MNEYGEKQTRVNDENFKHGLLRILNEFRKANFKCDTTVRVEGKDFPAHSIVLSAASDYFRAMFSTELQDKENQQDLVELKVIRSSVIEEVLEFIYLGQVIISSSNAYDLVVASDYLIIPSLKSQTEQFLKNSLDTSNCLTLESFACQYNCNSLRQAAIRYRNEHFVAIVKCEDFLSLEFEKIQELVCEDELNVSEEGEVYEAVMAWVKHDLLSRECFLPDLLKCLRLFSMSQYNIQRVLDGEELVKKNLICTAIMNKGLEFFLYPDQFLGRVLKHRPSIEFKEVVLLTAGIESGGAKSPQDTYCFDLATEKWQLLSPIPHSCLPSRDMVLAVCGGCVYLLSTNHSVISWFNPQENSWKSEETDWPSEIHAVSDFTVTSFNEELYVIGGFDSSLCPVDTVHKYNPVCNKWERLAPMDTARSDHCVAVVDDHIYVIAGFDGEDSLKSVVKYDPSTNQWTKVPDLATARLKASAATVSGKIVVVGGYNCNELTDYDMVDANCQMFDPRLNQWSLLPCPNLTRAACGIVSVGDVVYIFGGYHEETFLDSVERFDANGTEWEVVCTAMPVAKAFVNACLVKLPKKTIGNN